MKYGTIWGYSESERGMLRGVPLLLLGTNFGAFQK